MTRNLSAQRFILHSANTWRDATISAAGLARTRGVFNITEVSQYILTASFSLFLGRQLEENLLRAVKIGQKISGGSF